METYENKISVELGRQQERWVVSLHHYNTSTYLESKESRGGLREVEVKSVSMHDFNE